MIAVVLAGGGERVVAREVGVLAGEEAAVASLARRLPGGGWPTRR